MDQGSTNNRHISGGIQHETGLKLLKDTVSISVTVGKPGSTSTWTLPKTLLTYHSPFFSAALNGGFAEANSNLVLLSEDEPAIFELFVQWLYLGAFNEPAAVTQLVKAWSLGDRFGCILFQDHAMLHLIKIHHGDLSITPTTLRLAYELSTPDSKLRDWACNQFMLDSKYGQTKHAAKDWGELARILNDFPTDLDRTLAQDKAVENPFENANPYLENPLDDNGRSCLLELYKVVKQRAGWLSVSTVSATRARGGSIGARPGRGSRGGTATW